MKEEYVILVVLHFSQMFSQLYYSGVLERLEKSLCADFNFVGPQPGVRCLHSII